MVGSNIDEIKFKKEQMEQQRRYQNLNSYVMHSQKMQKQIKKKNINKYFEVEKLNEKK